MSKYSEKIDSIYDHVSNIRVNVASINQHLETLNGKVLNHRKRIEELEEDNQNNKIMWAKVMGAGAVIGAVASFLVSKLLGAM